MASANLNVMIKAARKAGRALVKDFREVENLQVSVKGAGDFVTRADRAAQLRLAGRRDRRGCWRGSDAALDRRSAGRDHQFPARPAALGRQHRAGAQEGNRRGGDLRCRQGRAVHRRKGCRRLHEQILEGFQAFTWGLRVRV